MQRTQGKSIRLTSQPLPARHPGVCLLCDDRTAAGQLIARAGRYGWVHVACADAGRIPPSATGQCGAFTTTGHPCRMAVVPGNRCRMHR